MTVRVLGPSWVVADTVELFLNDKSIKRVEVEPTAAVVKFERTWTLAWPERGGVLAVVATGPGVTAPYWGVAKPYQPTSTQWRPYLFGCSGAVALQEKH